MSKTLLLADDSITIQKVIQITFAHEDFELIITDNGDSAFNKAKEVVPDLVLADVYMPGRNGYELCAAIKQDPALRQVPVLLLAGSFEPFDEGKARAAGADAWIEKPFESQTLIDKVTGLLNAAAAPRPAAAPSVAVETPAEPAFADPFADISFEEPPASPAPAARAVEAADDWSDLNEPLAASPGRAEPDEFSFTEPAPAPPTFEFADEPLTPPPAIEPGAGVFDDADEIMVLDDDDILGAEDLESAGEMPTLSTWSREEIPLSDTFETFADSEPFAPAPEPVEPVAPVVPAPIEPIAPVEPVPDVAAEAPVEPEPAAPVETAPAVATAVEQRVSTLTEAELEQIVERAVGKVIERLAGSVLERVAWEVVPDLAESLIKEEIRKIKDAAA